MKNNKALLYLHGFLSSPQSLKAQLTIEYFKQYYPEVDIICPQLSNTPAQIKQQLVEIETQHKHRLIGVIGSSLGGYFATYCAHLFKIPAVLINPAVYPYLLLANYLGEHTHPYTSEIFQITDEYNQLLKSFEVANVTNLSIKAYIQTGDETLDYRQACQKFNADQICIIEGGDHAFQNYKRYLPEIADFLTSK